MLGVMLRNKRWVIVVLCVAVMLAGAYGAAYWYGNRTGSAVVAVMSPELKGGSVVLSVVTTNTGRVPLIYHGWPTFADLRVKTDQGWTNVPQHYASKTSTFGILLPGRSLRYSFTVPQDVTHVQVGCPFETAGARTWVFERVIEARWAKRSYQLWECVSGLIGLVPDGRREGVEFWSPETKIN
jgi:hypothetical protein